VVDSLRHQRGVTILRLQLFRLFSFLLDPEYRRRTSLLASNPLFAGLPPRMIGRLLPKMFEKEYLPDDLVFQAGDPGHGLFVILEGEVEILRAAPGSDEWRRIAVLGDASAFGELALIDEHPRSATVRVLKPSRLLILYRSDFERMIAGEPHVALALARNMLRVLARYARSAGTHYGVEAVEAEEGRRP
jgi:CRP/FNR family transcriptional regulator, cyclic AMP receptor protein